MFLVFSELTDPGGLLHCKKIFAGFKGRKTNIPNAFFIFIVKLVFVEIFGAQNDISRLIRPTPALSAEDLPV
jgi:hypothetical protein